MFLDTEERSETGDMGGKTLLHCIKALLHFEEGHSQTTGAERAMIGRFAAGAKRAVEIGVLEGVTTCVIASSIADGGRLFAVDPFFPGRLGVCYGKWIARSLVRRQGLSERVEFCQMLSWEAANHLSGSFDFLFLDGDHRLEAIERDWKDWSPRIDPGGCIALHDTSVPAHNPSIATFGSCQYFKTTIRKDPRFEHVGGVDSLNVLQRRS